MLGQERFISSCDLSVVRKMDRQELALLAERVGEPSWTRRTSLGNAWNKLSGRSWCGAALGRMQESQAEARK